MSRSRKPIGEYFSDIDIQHQADIDGAVADGARERVLRYEQFCAEMQTAKEALGNPLTFSVWLLHVKFGFDAKTIDAGFGIGTKEVDRIIRLANARLQGSGLTKK